MPFHPHHPHHLFPKCQDKPRLQWLSLQKPIEHARPSSGPSPLASPPHSHPIPTASPTPRRDPRLAPLGAPGPTLATAVPYNTLRPVVNNFSYRTVPYPASTYPNTRTVVYRTVPYHSGCGCGAGHCTSATAMVRWRTSGAIFSIFTSVLRWR